MMTKSKPGIDRGTQRFARLLVFAFGATTVMWLLCYVAMLQPGQVIGEALFVLVVLTLFLASAIAGSTSASSMQAAIFEAAGSVSSCWASC